MNAPSIENEILQQLAAMSTDEQRRVLAFARSLVVRTRPGEMGSRLAGVVGLIPREDLLEMTAAIEEHCERVDAGEW